MKFLDGDQPTESSRTLNQARDPVSLDVSVQRVACNLEVLTRGVDANFVGKPNGPHHKADVIQAWFVCLPPWTTALSGREQEASTFLVAVATDLTEWTGGVRLRIVTHSTTPGPDLQDPARNFN